MANGIGLPYPTRQILFHDQTEETDGDPARQREGWPKGHKQQSAGIGRAIVGAAEQQQRKRQEG